MLGNQTQTESDSVEEYIGQIAHDKGNCRQQSTGKVMSIMAGKELGLNPIPLRAKAAET